MGAVEIGKYALFAAHFEYLVFSNKKFNGIYKFFVLISFLITCRAHKLPPFSFTSKRKITLESSGNVCESGPVSLFVFEEKDKLKAIQWPLPVPKVLIKETLGCPTIEGFSISAVIIDLSLIFRSEAFIQSLPK